jgi:pyruvate dehydrogenase (quinone)
MPGTVAHMIVDVLEQVGVRQVFGLIGDSLNPLGDAIRRSSIEWIGVRHERGCARRRWSGETDRTPCSLCGHDGPGQQSSRGRSL